MKYLYWVTTRNYFVWIAFSVFIFLPIVIIFIFFDTIIKVVIYSTIAGYREIKDSWFDLKKCKPEFSKSNFENTKRRNDLAI